MKYTICFLSIFLLFSLAVVAQTKTEKESAAITAVMNEQAEAWNRGDIEGYMKGYWMSDKLVFVGGDNITRGWQATLDRYKKNYDSKAKMGTLSFSELEITLLSKDTANVIGSWSLAREKDNPKGKFTLIFRKFKDGWRIIQDHSS